MAKCFHLMTSSYKRCGPFCSDLKNASCNRHNLDTITNKTATLFWSNKRLTFQSSKHKHRLHCCFHGYCFFLHTMYTMYGKLTLSWTCRNKSKRDIDAEIIRFLSSLYNQKPMGRSTDRNSKLMYVCLTRDFNVIISTEFTCSPHQSCNIQKKSWCYHPAMYPHIRLSSPNRSNPGDIWLHSCCSESPCK